MGNETCFVPPLGRLTLGLWQSLQLSQAGQGLTVGFFPKDVLKKLPQRLAVLEGLSP